MLKIIASLYRSDVEPAETHKFIKFLHWPYLPRIGDSVEYAVPHIQESFAFANCDEVDAIIHNFSEGCVTVIMEPFEVRSAEELAQARWEYLEIGFSAEPAENNHV